MNFHDDCDFFLSPEILEKEERKIRLFEESCKQRANLIVAYVQFWMLHPKSIQLESLLAREVRLDVSHAAEILIAQGNPRNLWEGINQNYWFSCPGSPATMYGTPCFDFFRDAVCLSSFTGMNRPETEGGAASLFVQ
jgi:hypothetical protein